MRRTIALLAALACALLFIPSAGSADIADYQTVRDAITTSQNGSDHYAAKTASCPEGYASTAGGYRFVADDSSPDFDLTVSRDEPYGAFAPALGTGWIVSVRADRAGTLYVWSVCTV